MVMFAILLYLPDYVLGSLVIQEKICSIKKDFVIMQLIIIILTASESQFQLLHTYNVNIFVTIKLYNAGQNLKDLKRKQRLAWTNFSSLDLNCF